MPAWVFVALILMMIVFPGLEEDHESVTRFFKWIFRKGERDATG